ncbi:DASH complex subunit DAD3 family protein [Aspergillus undulatus]|uniref:DASH complex subunit DAD3 family protein n=1 Tax=Aspergillus undulatus TaxID=1810928 RepID=UPI003CCE1805
MSDMDITPTPSRTTTPTDPPDHAESLSPVPAPSTENAFLRPSHPLVSDLEQEVLDEYARLAENVNKLSDTLSTLADSPTTITLDGLRQLERKTATVCTLLKASVYSIILQQQMVNEAEAEQHRGQGMGQGGDTVTMTGMMDVGAGAGVGDVSYTEGY